MLALGCGHNRSVADEGVVDARVGDQVCLELVEIDVEGTVEAKRGGDGADNLGDEAVQVIVRWARNVKVTAADIVDSLVVDQEGTVGVLDGAVSRENGIVRLDNGCRGARSRVDRKLKFALLAVFGGKALKHEGTETRASATTERVEDQEALKGVTVVYVEFQSVIGRFGNI